MIRQLILKTAFNLKRHGLIHLLNDFEKSQWRPYEVLRNEQEQQLKKLIAFVYNEVPYYTKLFNQHGLKPDDVIAIKDLEKLPVLTKNDIRENWQSLIPKNINKIRYLSDSTGGSTGETLKYRMSMEDYKRGYVLGLRGWEYGGYRLADKVAVIAGSSLIPNTGSRFRKIIHEFVFNDRSYSSFEMSKENLFRYFHNINNWQPRFFYGYPSSIYIFAGFMRDNNLRFGFEPKAVFTTAEKLFDRRRELIESVFGVKVFDFYGLNDGGVSAHECEKHCGMHIDMERSILEVVDDKNAQIIDQKGRILATSLYNFATPFIRYETGDIGIISSVKCSCGREMPLLKEIIGRTTDFLRLNDTIIGSPVLTVLMGKFDIEQYQIIQKNVDSIVCRIVKGKNYDTEKNEQFIRRSFYSHVGQINISFEYTDSILTKGGSKHKFIINLMQQSEKPDRE